MAFTVLDHQRITFELIRDHAPELVDVDVIRVSAGDQVDVDVALRLLLDAGVVQQLGGRVGLTGAARRVLELGV